MAKAVGRLVIFIAVAALVIWGGWRVALGRADLQSAMFERAADREYQAASPSKSPLDAITATACGPGRCVLVEAGGRAFLVGASIGSAQNLAASGLLDANLDGVLLSDLSRASLSGLADIRDMTWEAGRRSPLMVYGPAGVGRAADGVNAMLEASDAAQSVRYPAGLLPFDAAPLASQSTAPDNSGEEIFDSGVLAIRAYPASLAAAGAELIYRFDYGGRALIVAGCGARVEDIRRASVDARQIAVVLPIADPALLDVERVAALSAGLDRQSRFITAPSEACLTPEAAAAALNGAGVDVSLAAPIYPAADTPIKRRIWARRLNEAAGDAVSPGWRGAQLTLPAFPETP